MLVMAKKRANKSEADEADRHKNTVVSFRPDAPLRNALQSLADQQRRSMAQMIVLLLEEALKAQGHWPPKQEGGK